MPSCLFSGRDTPSHQLPLLDDVPAGDLGSSSIFLPTLQGLGIHGGGAVLGLLLQLLYIPSLLHPGYLQFSYSQIAIGSSSPIRLVPAKSHHNHFSLRVDVLSYLSLVGQYESFFLSHWAEVRNEEASVMLKKD